MWQRVLYSSAALEITDKRWCGVYKPMTLLTSVENTNPIVLQFLLGVFLCKMWLGGGI